MELDDDVDHLNCLATQVSNVVNGFEQRRFSEKNFKVLTNNLSKEGRNVSQIILELEESSQMKSTNDIHSSNDKALIISQKIKKNASTKAKDGTQNILQNYLSNNSSNKSSTKGEYSISNYKTPNQSHVGITKDTPTQMVKGKISETKVSINIGMSPLQQATQAQGTDPKTLLSDHIKSQMRAVRNQPANQTSISNSKADKTVSKSCSKADELGASPS